MNALREPALWLRAGLRHAGTGGTLLVTATFALVVIAESYQHESRAVAFAVAGDTARTALADFYRATAAQGQARLPHSIAELGLDALPADPLTGRVDWVPERDPGGAITGFHSRSNAAVPDSAPLRQVARLNSTRGRASVQSELASDWSFAWAPPADTAAPRAASTALTANDALRGRWPGGEAGSGGQGSGMPAVIALSGQALRALGGLQEPLWLKIAGVLGRSGAIDAMPATPVAPAAGVAARTAPAPSLAQRISATLQAVAYPPAQILAAMASRTVAAPQAANTPSSTLQPVLLAAEAPAAAVDPTAPPGQAEGEVYSEDEATLDCQIKIAVNAEAACRGPRSFPDGGSLFQKCSIAYDERMRQCIMDFNSNQ